MSRWQENYVTLGEQARAGVIIALKNTLNAGILCQMNLTFEPKKSGRIIP
jgi:hypothetical protein